VKERVSAYLPKFLRRTDTSNDPEASGGSTPKQMGHFSMKKVPQIPEGIHYIIYEHEHPGIYSPLLCLILVSPL